MLRLDRVIKAWKEAAALNDHINLYGFWNETAFLTKSGDLGMVLRVPGVDYESLDHSQQEYAVKRLEAALKHFGPGFHIYQYLFKQNRPAIPFASYDDPVVQAAIEQRKTFFEQKRDHLYEIEIYYCILLEGARSKTGLGAALDCCRDKGVHALGNEMLRGTAPRMVPGALAQIQSSMVQGDTRFRFVWNTLWHYPQHETFHQFLDAMVVSTLGREWFEEQLHLPLKNQNAIVKWRTAMLELLRRPGDANDDVSTGHTLTGPAKAYQCFGYDLYWLQLVHKLPDSVIERLKDFRAFQGARYEVLIAAIFARAGFEIEWIDDDKASAKHPEFIATHKLTGKKVGVETKSRQRPGAMNYIGTVSPETHLKGDVFDLYDKAIRQASGGDLPFLIFIDPNVPDGPQQGLPSYSDIPVDSVPWMKEIRDRLVEIWNAATDPTPESAVLITNFAFYYGDNDSPSPAGMGAFFPSLKPRVPVLSDPMMSDLIYCLQTYGTVPRQV